MSREEWFRPKWLWLKRFSIAAVGGVVLIAIAVAADIPALAFPGALLVIPLVFWLAFIPVLHWKDRYIGDKSNLWGAFLVFETSSWSKLFYWFIHVLPDWKRSGQYSAAA